MSMATEMMVKQYIGEIQGTRGRWRVFATGSPKHVLFQAITKQGVATGLEFPVLRSRLKRGVLREKP